MNANHEEPPVLLSKNTKRTLLMRNAINQETLKKQSRLLEKEKSSEERLFLKKKEHLLKRQVTRGLETSQSRPSSSRSLNLENSVTKWKKATALSKECSQSHLPKKIEVNLTPMSSGKLENALNKWKNVTASARESTQSPKPRRKEIVGSNRRRRLLSALSLQSDEDEIEPVPLRSRSKTFSTFSSTVPLPDIHATSNGITGLKKYNDTQLPDSLEICQEDDWKPLRQCRYLRSSSGEEELCGI